MHSTFTIVGPHGKRAEGRQEDMITRKRGEITMSSGSNFLFLRSSPTKALEHAGIQFSEVLAVLSTDAKRRNE
jgi:phage replication-related protein YjqB (UPF0714/DUF867 family)